MVRTLARAPVFAAATPSVRRDLLLERISRAVGISQEALRAELARARRRTGRGPDEVETDAGAEDQAPARRGRRWAAERDLMTGLVFRPSLAESAAGSLTPDTMHDADFGRLFETIRSASKPRDKDIRAVLLEIEDQALADLAVSLFDRAESIEASRREGDTGPGPVVRMMNDAVEALEEMQAEDALAADGQAILRGGDVTEDVLRRYADGRQQRKGFLPPAVKKKADDILDRRTEG
jgi:hypothetical protein